MTCKKLDVRQKFIELTSRISEVSEAEISDSSHFVDDLGMNSMGLISLTYLAEQTFERDISKDPELAATLVTVGKTVRFIESQFSD